MNFEKFLNTAINCWPFLKKKKIVKSILLREYDFFLLRKKKMKLGAIVFIIKEHKFEEFVLWQEPTIKFINQDTSVADSKSFEAVSKIFDWELNWKNCFTIALILCIIFYNLYIYFKKLYYTHLPSLAFREEVFDYLVKCGFENIYTQSSFTFLQFFSKDSFWLVEILTQFAIHYNIIF